MIIGERKERVDYRGKSTHYKGNPRHVGDHPFDRKSGTGRGREAAKGGHGKGNWGDMRDEVAGQIDAANIDKPATEATGEETKEPKAEGEEATPVKEEVVEPERQEFVEEEVKGLTLEEYLAQKKKPTQRKEARQSEALKKDNIEKVDIQKQKVETIDTTIRNQDTYSIATGKNENAVLLGFQGQEDEYEPRERGARGGRGGRGRGTRGSRGGQGGERTGGRGGERTSGRGGRQQ